MLANRKINFLEELEELKALIQGWADLSSEDASSANKQEVDKKWMTIMDKVGPIFYLYPKYKFYLDDDSCSDFYLFSYDSIEKILRKAIEAKHVFSFYLLKSIKNQYFKFLQSKKRDNEANLNLIREGELQFAFADRLAENSLDNYIYKRNPHLFQSEIFSENDEFAGTNAEEGSLIYNKIREFLQDLSGKERFVIKLYFSFPLDRDDFQYFGGSSKSEKREKFQRIVVEMQKSAIEENLERKKILKRIHKLNAQRNFKYGDNQKNEIISKLQEKFWKSKNLYSVRKIAELSTMSKSTVQRVITSFQEKIKLKLQDVE